jgi:diguanylate cyclase (GGDEF)-like protein
MKNRTTNPPVVLYVSDDTAYLNAVRHNLGQAGFSVVTVKSPAEVVELTQQSDFDALLADYNLIQTDGLTLFSQIKKRKGDATPPTLMLADEAEEVLISRCKAAGTEGLYVKSDSHEDLIDRVLSIIRDPDKRNRVAASIARRHFKGGTDTLTRVATQEHFTRRLNGESMASYRDHSFLSLLMITIDRFERLDEQYGKKMAEHSLAQVARLIESELRSRDCVARFADHTFAVVLPDTNQTAALAVGRRLRRKLAGTELGNLDQPISITVSIGATTRPPGTRKAPKELSDEAWLSSEAALKMGGDRVLADTGLTGAPLVLVVGDPSSEVGPISTVIEDCDKVEMRLATSYEEALKVLSEVPVAMVMSQEGVPGARTGIELLEWVRNKFPAIHRVLIADHVDPSIMVKAVNQAAINYFIPVPSNLSKIGAIIEELLFT